MIKNIFVIALSFLCIQSIYAAPELVMHENTTITAQKDGKSLTIIAGKGNERAFEQEGCKLNSKMIERKTRWFGELGIYDPAFNSPNIPCKNIYRAVASEAQIHFDNIEFAKEWFERSLAWKYTSILTDDGLFVAWNTQPSRSQLGVYVLRLCLNGKPLTGLPGTENSLIKIRANGKGQTIHDCTVVSQDEVKQTRTQLEKEWSQLDYWRAINQNKNKK